MNGTNGLSRQKLIDWLEDRAAWWRRESGRLLAEAEQVQMWIVSASDPAGEGERWADLKADGEEAFRNAIALMGEAMRLKGEG